MKERIQTCDRYDFFFLCTRKNNLFRIFRDVLNVIRIYIVNILVFYVTFMVSRLKYTFCIKPNEFERRIAQLITRSIIAAYIKLAV